MKTSTFHSSQEVPHPLPEVFGFFSDARNLERITPPFLKFRVLTPEPLEMREGAIIDYRLRVRGLPMRWRSEIRVWDPPHRFVDVQLRGPYRKWEHTHAFREVPGGTLIEDRVEYAVPGGALVDRFLVRPDVERIFAYRRDAIEELLAAG